MEPEQTQIIAVRPVRLSPSSPFPPLPITTPKRPKILTRCLPIAADCNTAVLNFPQCANTTWNMFQDRLGGYFCCEQGQIAVQSEFAGRNGPLCEPPDQVVPASLLATLYPQATPTASSTPSNTTQAGNANQTNPVASVSATKSPSSSSSSSDPLSGIAAWPNSKKIGLGVAAFVAIVFAVAVCSFLNRRRRNRNVIRGYNGYGYTGEDTFDEFGNLVPRAAYGASRVGLPGYEPYRRGTPGPSSEGNHVTVNVVHGDQTT